jgi:hypothetical protein
MSKRGCREGFHVKRYRRYLVDDSYYGKADALANGCPGPILFYTGNEGDIEGFWGGNGFMVT